MTKSSKTLAVICAALLIGCMFAALPTFAEDTSVTPTIDQQAPDQPAPEAKKEKAKLTLLPTFNTYFPSDSATQDRFGDSWTSIGLSLAVKTKRLDPRRIELRLDGIAQKSSKTSAYIFPVGIGWNTILSTSNNLTTYAGVTGNLYIAKLKSIPDNVDTGWSFRGGAGAIVGANIGKRLNVQGAYYLIPELGGFKLSGFNLSAHLQLWQF